MTPFQYDRGSLKEISVLYADRKKSIIPTLATSKEIEFKDLDGDGVKEIIIMPIRNYGNEFVEPTYYFRWNGREFVQYDQRTVVYRGNSS